MQKVYLMSEFGTLFDARTGEHFPVEEAGRIVAVCALRPQDVMGDYGYLAVVEQADAERAVASDRQPAEPEDTPFIRQAGMAPSMVLILNRRTSHVVN